MEEMKHGLIEGRQISDYIAGGNSPLEHIKLTDGDWLDYKPEHERQFNYAGMYDTLMCVTYATTDALESLMMYHLSKGNINPVDVKWLQTNGYFKNGLINLNERYSAINGQTTTQGAYQFNVINGIRHEGCIPQDSFTMADNFLDNIDSRFITDEMRTLGREFARRFPFSYEWVDDGDIEEYLTYSPLTASVRFQQPDNPEQILSPEGQSNHRIMVYKTTDTWIGVNDSYDELKRYAPGYVHSFMAFYLETNNMIYKKEKYSPNIYLIDEVKKTKTMIIDMPTLNALNGEFTEVDSLSGYTDSGTLVFIERVIN
jgi:hypothetical protein